MAARGTPNECMDPLPRTRASPEPMGHHRGVKPGRPPEFCATLKLLFLLDILSHRRMSTMAILCELLARRAVKSIALIDLPEY
jgi:hypothetical protein